nr:hypothetical protein MZNIZDYX_MZNIZDYX_CDS_0036 [uncultured phage]CAI9752159.1 hypothetical protein GCSOEBMH_GCSOEBMH_CDS_0036 [uncultured phage]
MIKETMFSDTADEVNRLRPDETELERLRREQRMSRQRRSPLRKKEL